MRRFFECVGVLTTVVVAVHLYDTRKRPRPLVAEQNPPMVACMKCGRVLHIREFMDPRVTCDCAPVTR